MGAIRAEITQAEYDDNGIDLERLRANLRLTLEQRVERHRRACESLIALRNGTTSARPSVTHRSA